FTIKPASLRLHLESSVHLLKVNLDLVLEQIWKVAEGLLPIQPYDHCDTRFDDLFPTTLTEAHVGHTLTSNASEPNPCIQNTSFLDDHCVSRAYQKMQALLDSSSNTVHQEWTSIFRESTFARVITLHEHIETWTRAPHLATGYVQNILWWDPTWFFPIRLSLNGRTSVIKSQAPNVRTVCLGQKVTISTTQVEFPLLELDTTYLNNATAVVTVEPQIWSQDNRSFVDEHFVRTVWVDGAQNIEAVTAGLVVLEPLQTPNDTVRSALACSVDARWGDSNHTQADGLLDIAISADERYLRRDDRSGSGFRPANNSHWRHVKASMAWLDALTPTVPYLSPTLELTQSASTIANLLTSTGHTQLPPIDGFLRGHQDSPYEFWESLIATYFADGVARVGYSRQLDSPLFFVDGSLRDGHDCVKTIPAVGLNVSTCPDDRPVSGLTGFSLTGSANDVYAYRASAKTDYASVSILLVYVCIATAHFLYCIIRRHSSCAWEKLDDLLNLALDSQPDPAVLSNTSAGMKISETKAKAVGIFAMKGGGQGRDASLVDDEEEEDEESDDEEQRAKEISAMAKNKSARNEEAVQMRYVESMHDGKEFGRVKPGMRYGKMD
ncbi:MAG: hypothetical protein Q9191_002735, partial [Dirinaria sp. TL-2023a]